MKDTDKTIDSLPETFATEEEAISTPMSESAPLDLLPVAGIRTSTTCAGIKYAGRRDLVAIEAAAGSACAAVFTRNAFCAAPVSVAKRHLSVAAPRYLLINTGNANAGTGQRGLQDAELSCTAFASLTQCQPQEVLPFSTGVIGEPLPLERLIAALPQVLAALRPDGWAEAAQGIMTTDTRPKGASLRLTVAGRTITLTGIAKGAGMIEPDMATMLAFIATDAGMDKALLQRCLAAAVADSFNAITVDGDTSTNDACVLLATGQAGLTLRDEGEAYTAFAAALRELCIELAQGLVRDGEGATKFITIDVEQGRDPAECRQVAYTIAHSPLVKTAFFASDPNWGRILAAVGRAGLPELALDAVVLYLDEVCIVRNGGRAEDYTEERGQQVMRRGNITIRVQLGRAAPRRVSGPPICRSITSASTPSIAPEDEPCASLGRRRGACRGRHSVQYPRRGVADPPPYACSSGRSVGVSRREGGGGRDDPGGPAAGIAGRTGYHGAFRPAADPHPSRLPG